MPPCHQEAFLGGLNLISLSQEEEDERTNRAKTRTIELTVTWGLEGRGRVKERF